MGRAAIVLAVVMSLLIGAACFGAAVLGAAVARGGDRAAPLGVGDIPAEYLAAYRAAAARSELGSDGWSYLAAIGEVESDHGRSSAPGVHSGQNSYGCCAGPMQIDNGAGSGGGTWAAYATDGDHDGRADIYSAADATATAARYLRMSGAPADWRRAIFAYNHADWYVQRVLERARSYRTLALRTPVTTTWLARLPSFPGERCDARIVGEVERIAHAYGLLVTDCFGGGPHAAAGEHPLGLAVDWVPADGDWRRTLQLARDAGWRTSCAARGCPGAGPFRVVLWDGYPGHGDPAHSSTPHLHTSWTHGPAVPFSRAPWVRLVLAAP
jgi:hypothetical protein